MLNCQFKEKRMKRIAPLLFGLLMFPLNALAKEPKVNKLQERYAFVSQFAGEAKPSVVFMRYDSFELLGDHSILLYESMNRAYVVDVDNFCRELPWAFAIGVENHGNTLSARFDSLRVRGQSCRIMQIKPVDVKAMKLAQKKLRDEEKLAKQ
jgi:hypothetical protein